MTRYLAGIESRYTIGTKLVLYLLFRLLTSNIYFDHIYNSPSFKNTSYNTYI